MSCGAGGCGTGGGCGVGGGCGTGGGCSSGGCGSGAAASNGVHVVGVKFPSTARTFHYDSGSLALELGEDCVVDTDRGPAYGRVTQPARASDIYTRGAFPLKKVLRRATFEDRERFEQASGHEKEAYTFCRQRIESRRLPMKLVNVHSSLGEEKMTFFFTADGRVDFRALVRDLASRFQMRVEMRQIGVRDAAKMLGGYGDCGRPLCCSTFLKHFEPITIQMAKAQDLSLNPARISGMCGRLKCCLRYEYVPGDRPRKKRRPGAGPEEPAVPDAATGVPRPEAEERTAGHGPEPEASGAAGEAVPPDLQGGDELTAESEPPEEEDGWDPGETPPEGVH